MTELGAPSSDRTLPVDRSLAAAGIVGVSGFVVAWALAGARRDGYSPVHDAISRLAEVGAPDRGWMTAGFVAFGIGVPLYAQALRRRLRGPAWIAATVTGLSIIGVAVSPLGRADRAHYIFATAGYLSLIATPLLAAHTFRRAGATSWARWSVLCGVASALALAASTFDRGHGFSQRLGLSITDAWIVVSAWSMCRSEVVKSP